MKSPAVPFALVLVLTTASALADDGAAPAPPKPDAAAAAKKERTTSPEAEAVLAKYASLLHFPNAKYKSVGLSARASIPQLGGDLTMQVTYLEGKPLVTKVTLPEATRQAYGEQAAAMESQMAGQFSPLFAGVLVPPTVMARQYDLVLRTKDGKSFVDMKRFDDKADWDKATLEFGADGLLAKESGTPHVDPDDPMSAAMAGTEIEIVPAHGKRGDLHVVEGFKITQPMGETTVKVAYYEITGAPPLPKEFTIVAPMMPEPLVISVSDWIVDGKPVAGTKHKEEKKPEAPAPKKDDKPVPPK